MDDYSHIGYHRGDWFRYFGIFALLLVVVAFLISIFSRVGMHDKAGNTGFPPDWPKLGWTIDAAATDLVFDPDIRTMGGALSKVAQKTSKSSSTRNSEPVLWQIHFNHPDPPEQFLARTEQALQAAGWTSGGGRTMEHFAQTGLLDLNFVDPNNEFTMQVRYWAQPPMNYGNAANPQHWMVMIMRKRY